MKITEFTEFIYELFKNALVGGDLMNNFEHVTLHLSLSIIVTIKSPSVNTIFWTSANGGEVSTAPGEPNPDQKKDVRKLKKNIIMYSSCLCEIKLRFAVS